MYNPFNPPIEAIIGSLNNTVAKLEAFSAKAAVERAAKLAQAASLEAEARVLLEESGRANRVSYRIRSLID